MAILKILLLLLAASSLQGTTTSQCDVQVATEPEWPRTVYVPRNASVFINCNTSSSNSFWAIDLAGDDFNVFLPFATSREYLNDHGVYELERPGMLSALRLLINNTEINNHTMIRCYGGTKLYQTTLYLYKSSASVLKVEGMGTEQAINISLTDQNPNRLQMINLTIYNTISQQWVFQLQQPYYVFIAPEGASPCEIYSFKSSHTYVGATYSGAGCSVHSPVLSTILPSLPDISILQSSHNFSLEKVAGKIILTVYFQPATSCSDYPVTNYTIEITRVGVASSGIQLASVVNFIKAENLSNDAVYVYQLSATNSVGTVSTNSSREVYTTDVQAIEITATHVSNQIKILCVFIQGSNAEGCMVVFKAIEGLDNATVNLTRPHNSSKAIGLSNLPYPLPCYYQVYTLDIEVDGSIGTVPLPRELGNHLTNVHSVESCILVNVSKPLWVIGPTVSIVIIMLAIITAVIIVVIVLRVHPRFKTHSRSGRFSIRFSYYDDSAIQPRTSQSRSRFSIPNRFKHGHNTSHENVANRQASSKPDTNTQLANCYDDVTTTPEVQVVFPHFQSNTEELLDSLYIDKPQSFLELQGGPNEHNIGIGRATPNSHSGTSVTLNSTYWDIEDSEATTINDAPTGQVDYYSSPPPHYVSESEREGHKSDCVHDEIAEHPRVISPFDSSPPLHICTPPNSTHFPLKTSNLATNIKAVSYSNQVNILEQYPQRELASSNPLLDPITHQRSNTSLQNCHVHRAPEMNLNKSNGYRIPTGGTLV